MRRKVCATVLHGRQVQSLLAAETSTFCMAMSRVFDSGMAVRGLQGGWICPALLGRFIAVRPVNLSTFALAVCCTCIVVLSCFLGLVLPSLTGWVK